MKVPVMGTSVWEETAEERLVLYIWLLMECDQVTECNDRLSGPFSGYRHFKQASLTQRMKCLKVISDTGSPPMKTLFSS